MPTLHVFRRTSYDIIRFQRTQIRHFMDEHHAHLSAADSSLWQQSWRSWRGFNSDSQTFYCSSGITNAGPEGLFPGYGAVPPLRLVLQRRLEPEPIHNHGKMFHRQDSLPCSLDISWEPYSLNSWPRFETNKNGRCVLPSNRSTTLPSI